MIRPATKEDVTEITALWNTMIRDTSVTFTSLQKLQSDVALAVADPERCFLVAQSDGAFAGFALLGPFRSGPGYAHCVEHTVYVLPQAFGKGLGRMLMAGLSDFARAQGHHVMIGAVSGTNADAVAFHKRLGFEQVGHLPQVGRKGDDWHDLILMHKFL